MQPLHLVFVVCACVLLITSVRHSNAFSINRADLSDPELTIAVLEELAADIRGKNPSSENMKRGFDGGYGNRYGVAQSLGSKLMALKTAADWNNPGRKRRDAEEMH